MTSVISVKNLKKYYSVHQKEPGFFGSIKSLFSRKYIEVKAVNGVSFKISEGELVGFIGPNGAGKTTTLKVLSGLLYPTSGDIKVLGFEPFKRKSQFQKQFSLIMGQKNQLFWDLPSWETFILNKEIYEIPEDKFKQIVFGLAEMLKVKDILKIQVRKLSLGQRMKCELIAALIHSPKVLFLDEPTIGLDVLAQKNMRDFIKEYNSKFRATIILTSHYMGDVKELCKRIIIINEGKILYDGLLEKIVNKFAPFKLITVYFDSQSPLVQEEKLKSIGKIEEFDSIHAKIQIERKDVSEKTSKILSDFNVSDLSVEDLPIEDIIRDIFASKNGQYG